MQTNHPLHARGFPSSSARPLRVRFNVGQEGSEMLFRLGGYTHATSDI